MSIVAPRPHADHTQPTSVYLYFDASGILIYVGITSRGMARNMEHNRDKPWWWRVDRQEVEHFATREKAHAREVELIQFFKPPYNVQHNPDWEAVRRVYESDHMENIVSPGRVLAQQGKWMPLALVEVRREKGTRLVFSTPHSYSSIVSGLSPCTGVRVVAPGYGRVGTVTSFDLKGVSGIITAETKARVTFDQALAKLSVVAARHRNRIEIMDVNLQGCHIERQHKPNSTASHVSPRQQIWAPWDATQVDALNRWQRDGFFRFYCQACVQTDGRKETFEATQDGWVCRICGERQMWAAEVMLTEPSPTRTDPTA